MNKQQFLDTLEERLSGLPKQDAEECLGFYSEMIDDRIEEGLSEESAVADMGSIDEIVAQTVSQIPLNKLVKEKIKRKKEKIRSEKVKEKRKMPAWEIVLLCVGSPIWLSLIIAAIAVIIALFAVAASVIISLWAVFAALVGCAVGGVISAVLLCTFGNAMTGIALIGAAVFCAGLSIFAFLGFKALTGQLVLGIKKCFVVKKKEKKHA